MIHELHVAVIEASAGEPVAGLEGLLNEVPAPHIAELHPDLRAAPPHLDVLELDDLIERSVELDGHAALDLTCTHHMFRLRRGSASVRRS